MSRRATAQLTKCDNGWIVETWRNNTARAWVVQVKDSHDIQRGTDCFEVGGESLYLHRSSFAKIAHDRTVDEINKLPQAAERSSQ